MNEYFFRSPLPSSPEESEESVGSFVLGRVLGRGCTGVVREAMHRRTGFRVAIKMIDKSSCHFEEHPELLKQVRREIAILRLTSHRHVLQLHDVLETTRHIFLVLELVENGDLFEKITRQGRIPREEALVILHQLTRALLHLHAYNIAHRDIKPENVLIDSKGDVKLADFGMAQLFRPDSSLLKTSCGSPHYASPEVVRGRGSYDAKQADVWSLGVLLYAMLTGCLPFDHDNIPMLLQRVLAGKYHMPSSLDKDIAHLIRRMLTMDPHRRIRCSDILNHRVFAHLKASDTDDGCDDKRNSSYAATMVEKNDGTHCLSPSSTRTTCDDLAMLDHRHANIITTCSSNNKSTVSSPRPVSERTGEIVWTWPAAASAEYTHVGPSDATVLKDLDSLGILNGTEQGHIHRVLQLRKAERMQRLATLSPQVDTPRRLHAAAAAAAAANTTSSFTHT